jgi:hypothetical protein
MLNEVSRLVLKSLRPACETGWTASVAVRFARRDVGEDQKRRRDAVLALIVVTEGLCSDGKVAAVPFQLARARHGSKACQGSKTQQYSRWQMSIRQGPPPHAPGFSTSRGGVHTATLPREVEYRPHTELPMMIFCWQLKWANACRASQA